MAWSLGAKANQKVHNGCMSSPREPVTERLHVRLTNEEMEKLRRYCSQKQLTLTEATRNWIRKLKA